jgi:DNA-binding response OmpR family regulator
VADASAGTDESHSRGPILLVEDDSVLAEVLERYLTAHRHRVTVADSTEEATRLLESGLRPGLVILDINLPGESGWALMRDAAYADSGAPPVVVATATHVSTNRLREFGVAGYLPKPFPTETLLATVDRLLAGVASGS